jgi:hypothetical protein
MWLIKRVIEDLIEQLMTDTRTPDGFGIEEWR